MAQGPLHKTTSSSTPTDAPADLSLTKKDPKPGYKRVTRGCIPWKKG